jgi:hypothetical protein
MRRTVVSLAVAALALVAAPVAHATELAPDTRAEIAQLASSTPGRCAGRVSIVWAHELATVRPDIAAQGLEVMGVAYGVADGGCTIAVVSDADPALACTVALHEVGHLNGEQHGNGDPVMGDAGGEIRDYRAPRCADVVAITRDDAISAMWQHVSERTKVACKRTSAATFTCVSSRRLVRKTWQVTGRAGGRISARVVGAVA